MAMKTILISFILMLTTALTNILISCKEKSGTAQHHDSITNMDSIKSTKVIKEKIDSNKTNNKVLKMAEKIFKNSHYDRYQDGEDFPTYPVAYVISPDSTYLYVVTRVHANSNGWTSEYQIQQYNVQKRKYKFITECAGIMANSDGIRVAYCRLANGNKNPCTSDEIWKIHDVYYRWNGTIELNDTSMEYNYSTFKARYINKSREYCYVKGTYFFPDEFVNQDE